MTLVFHSEVAVLYTEPWERQTMKDLVCRSFAYELQKKILIEPIFINLWDSLVLVPANRSARSSVKFGNQAIVTVSPEASTSPTLNSLPSTNTYREWPKPPWTLPGLTQSGFIAFEYYGRRLPPSPSTISSIHYSVNDLYHALFYSFKPQIQDYFRGVAHLHVELEPTAPATREQILEVFFWLRIVVDQYRQAPTEVKGAVLFAQGEIRAHFALTFPGVKDAVQEGIGEE
ncbi:MAG: hypothetical protein Q9219_006089 [cf. Caloplaca sp. 3 TL-2023]